MSLIIHARVRTSAVQASNCLASLFALELLSPSNFMYLSVPSLRNVPVVPNYLRQFGSLFPEMDTPFLSLSTALMLLSERGVNVRLICSQEEESLQSFLSQLPPTIEGRTGSPLYHRGLYSEHFSLCGHLQFTSYGVDVAEDRLELITELDEVSQRLLEVSHYWEDLA